MRRHRRTVGGVRCCRARGCRRLRGEWQRRSGRRFSWIAGVRQVGNRRWGNEQARSNRGFFFARSNCRWSRQTGNLFSRREYHFGAHGRRSNRRNCQSILHNIVWHFDGNAARSRLRCALTSAIPSVYATASQGGVDWHRQEPGIAGKHARRGSRQRVPSDALPHDQICFFCADDNESR